jgi:hypothetical protein
MRIVRTGHSLAFWANATIRALGHNRVFSFNGPLCSLIAHTRQVLPCARPTLNARIGFPKVDRRSWVERAVSF